MNAKPKATVVPVVALIFVGQHEVNTVPVALRIPFIPIAASEAIGLSTLEPKDRDMLRSPGAWCFTIFWKIALPKALREFLGALKVAVTLAFNGTTLVGIVTRPWPRFGAPVPERTDEFRRSTDVCGACRAGPAGHPAAPCRGAA